MKLNRLFEIIYLLLDQETIAAKELADYFEVSTRTIYRDIDTLSAAGIPIYTNRGKGGGISLLPNYVLDRTVLTATEKETIISSMTALNQVQPDGGDGVERIRSLLGSQQPDWVEVDFSTWHYGEKEASLFGQLKEAIFNRQLIRCEYFNGKGESSQRTLQPLKLCYTSFAWYLYGYCHLRQDVRFFKLKRMRKLEVLDERGTHHVEGNILSQHKDYRQDGEVISVRVEVAHNQLYRVIEEFPEYEETGNGNYLVTVDYQVGSDLFAYLLSFGPYAKILSPSYLQDEFKDYVTTIKNLYL